MDVFVDFIPLILMLCALGCCAGFLAGLLGIGGGIVLVPGLYFILTLVQANTGFDPSHIMHICVGTSLAMIVPTGFSSARAHHKRDAVDFGVVRRIGAGIILGVIWATYVVNGLDGRTLTMFFASALPVFALFMMIGKARFVSSQQNDTTAFVNMKDRVAGVFIGFVSSLMGIGGATISVPYMSMSGMHMHRAVGTAAALGLVISVPAVLGFMVTGYGQANLPPFSIGYVSILAWVCVVPFGVLVAPIGVKVSHSVQVKPLRIGFAIFMILVALNMWRKILMG